ncbi:MAG: branched-chain amino acid transport system permease protein [Parasphingorhabdus sp.]|jgi:branched-chain amino acid transport system permease protein
MTSVQYILKDQVLLTFLVILLLSSLVPDLFGPYWAIVALNLMMWIALTQSWTLFSGMTGYISLGHVVFYGVGAYVVASTFKVLPLWVSVPLAGFAAGLLALVVAIPVLRVRGPYFVILTFGLAELVKYSVLNIETAMGKSSRLLFGAPTIETLLYGMIALAVVAALITKVVSGSRFGRGLAAIRDDETTAETVGVPVVKYKIAAFTLSAIIPGMAGGLMALKSTYFEVLQVFNPVISFTIVTMAIIGGSGDARGPFMGAAFLLLLSELFWATIPQIYMILLGLFLIGFVIFAPNGIATILWPKQTRDSQ